jgi:hypothetical protein
MLRYDDRVLMKILAMPKASCRVAAFVLLTISVVLLSRHVAAQNYLYNVTDLGVGSGPAGVIFKDLNRDGVLDLAVTNFSTTLSLFSYVYQTDNLPLR